MLDQDDAVSAETCGDELIRLCEILRLEGLTQKLDVYISPSRGGWSSFFLEYVSLKQDVAGHLVQKDGEAERTFSAVLLTEENGDVLYLSSERMSEIFGQSCELGLAVAFEADSFASVGHVWPYAEMKRHQLAEFTDFLTTYATECGMGHLVLRRYDFTTL